MPIMLDVSKSWIEGLLASHDETAWLGLVECSLATWSLRCTTPLTVHQYHEAFDPLHVNIDSIPNMLGFNVSATNVSVRSGKLFQTAQAVFLPHPIN